MAMLLGGIGVVSAGEWKNIHMGINVLSVFDGMACGLVALKRAGIQVDNYFASEIDPYAMRIAKKNHPEIVHLGNIENWREWDLPKIDLLIGGSPCQGFSQVGHGKNFDDPRSKLFFVYVDILFHLIDQNPKIQFGLENVKMKQEWQNVISDILGVDPVEINSALVSAQVRKRLYWANWKIEQPEDENLVIYDVLEDKGIPVIKSHGEYQLRPEKAMCLDANYWKGADNHGQRTIIISSECIELGHAILNGHDFIKRVYSIWGKCPTLTAVCGGNQHRKIAMNECQWRKLTPLECERLQTLPDGYTEGVSNTQRYKMLGNGWTVDVIAHILKSNPKLI